MPIINRIQETGSSLSEMLHNDDSPVARDRAKWFVSNVQSITNDHRMHWKNVSAVDSFNLELKGEVQEVAENLMETLKEKFGVTFKKGAVSGYTPYMMVSQRKKIEDQNVYFIVSHSRNDLVGLSIRF